MPTNFPGSADTFPSEAQLAASTLGTDPHSKLHGDLGDALAAVESYILTTLTAALAGKQPLNANLTAIAALTTQAFGRSLLEAVNAAAAQALLGISAFVQTILDDADAAAVRATIGAGTSSAAGANPSASVGLTAVNGSAATFLRSDGAPALSQSITPTWTGQHIHSIANAAAWSIGPNGTTNPTCQVKTDAASCATGIEIQGAAAGSGVTIQALSSGSNEDIKIAAKGSGYVKINSGGSITIPGIYSPTLRFDPENLITVARTDYPANGVVSFGVLGGYLYGFYLASEGIVYWSSSSRGSVGSASGSYDLGLGRTVAGVGEVNDAAGSLAWLRTAGNPRLTADSTNATTTMGNLTDLSETVKAGRAYGFRWVQPIADSVAADGVKADLDGGSATMTSIQAHGLIFDSTGLLTSLGTSALATDLVAATLTGDGLVVIEGSFVVNAGGTFIPRVAQNAHTTGTLTAYKHGRLTIWELKS